MVIHDQTTSTGEYCENCKNHCITMLAPICLAQDTLLPSPLVQSWSTLSLPTYSTSPQRVPSFSYPLSVSHSQALFSNSKVIILLFRNEWSARLGPLPPDWLARGGFPCPLLGQRRVSEPSIFGSTGSIQSNDYPNPAMHLPLSLGAVCF